MSIHRALTATLSLGLLSLCCSCSGSSTGPTGTPASSAPVTASGPAATPAVTGKPVSGNERTALGPVSLTLPRGFTTVEVPSTETAHRYGARGPATTEAAGPAAIAVVVQDKPTRKAKAEAEAGVKIVGSAPGGKATSIKLKQVQVAGADDAWTLNYDQKVGVDPVHAVAMVADVGGQLVVIQARAGLKEYSDSGLAAALASVELRS